MRARKPKGSVVFNRLRATWNFLWCEGNQRRSRKLGTLVELPTKADALRKAEAVRRDLRLQRERAIVTVRQLVEQFRVERMPERFSTRYGYEAWLRTTFCPVGAILQLQTCKPGLSNCGSSLYLSLQRAEGRLTVCFQK